ncbi:MAG: lycopene cyclase domain-containing protein [Candidatus Omnitrophica bacterium]|jgi:lycopene cyclase domain-containing protein|nr:lycopene cyclase domain-containing protein [Candidatus Omnitrophota bacterium]MDD3275230.1 lycopene cyclase domain-containing protein [Candidatus Omnitrophota bacterium]MDD5077626.1 lycopene cyclase domain-containing protein [Candidatus Omnitrophota bacterium]MDD5724792.1 lycopene cyclase domain-containing protein [Candidatus Omnitrophota bacterium]
MKEYTVIAFFSVVFVVLADRLSGVNILRRKLFYFFLAVIFGFKLAVNGYLTGAGIVRYCPEYFLGLRLGSIPFEDFLFGFSMVALTVISWEFWKKKGECVKK